MMERRLSTLVATTSLGIGLSGGFALAAHGQGVERRDQRVDPQATEQGPQRLDPIEGVDVEGLRPVDAGVGDVSTLGTSLRLLPGDLQVPTGFSRVYEMPGRPGWLMRANGGLYAIFRESIYVENYTPIPDDTTFTIGPPLELMRDVLPGAFLRAPMVVEEPSEPDTETTEQHEASPAGTFERSPDQGPRQLTVVREAPVPSLISNGAYRRYRIMELMRHAVSTSDTNDSDASTGG